MNSSDILRKFRDIVEAPEAAADARPRDAQGRVAHPDIEYKATDSKVTANLGSYQSQTYTKLAQKVNRIKALEKKTKMLKEEVTQLGRDNVQELFSADDKIRTRVVETVSFIMTLTKDPEATTTYKYASILEELESHLTPELIKVLEGLKNKYESSTQKAAALKIVKKESVDLSEGVWDQMKAVFSKFLALITNWAASYDQKLGALKAQAGMNESLGEDEELDETTRAQRISDKLRVMLGMNQKHGTDPEDEVQRQRDANNMRVRFGMTPQYHVNDLGKRGEE